MPIPFDYNPNLGQQDDESLYEAMDEVTEDAVEEQEDGSAIVRLDKLSTPEDDPDFYENLAESIDEYDLGSIAIKYVDLIDKDKEAREDRDKKYEEGIRRTGLGDDASGGVQFLGASKVVHPVMAESCIDRKSVV